MTFNKAKIKAILWDVDGTLFSSEGMIHTIYARSFHEFRSTYGKPKKVPSLPEIMEQVGKPVKVIFENLAPDLDERERSQLSLTILHGLVRGITFGEGEHYDGVTETLRKLRERGYEFWGVSNGRYPYVEAILRKNGTYALFRDVPFVDNRTIHNKNELVAYCLRAGGYAADEAVVIGDRTSDRDAAISNGVPFIAAAYGHGTVEEWEGAAAVIQDIKDLSNIL